MASSSQLRQKQVATRRLWVFPHVAVPVFLGAAGLILGFVVLGIVMHAAMLATAQAVHAWIAANLGWFYTGSVALFPLVCVALALSRYGRVRLGDPQERPRFGRPTWFAMLFSAGMGIGLLFWSVAEPVSHYLHPPFGDGGTVEAGHTALRLTFFHWGLHAWAIYAVTALGLAFFTFRHKLPLSLRSVFYPLVGDRIYGPFGHVVDIFAVLGTMFGVATSLGLGVLQVNAGLDYLFAIGQSRTWQIALIAGITAAATASVVSGLDRGISLLSRLNVLAALGLLAAVLALGPTAFLLDAILEATGDYLQNLIQLSLWTQATEDGQWQADWTLFYWGWWISWSPFVGTFIARVSRGRTIREFVIGVLLVPTAAVLVWMTVFGATAIWAQHTGLGALAPIVEGEQVSRAFFALLDLLPGAQATAALATVIVMLFFVTSSDSGSLVIDMLTAGGHTDPPKVQRVFWAVTEGVVAATLLLGGGLQALQAAAITTGLPIAAILLVLCWTLYRGLADERPHTKAETPERTADQVMGLAPRERSESPERGPASGPG